MPYRKSIYRKTGNTPSGVSQSHLEAALHLHSSSAWPWRGLLERNILNGRRLDKTRGGGHLLAWKNLQKKINTLNSQLNSHWTAQAGRDLERSCGSNPTFRGRRRLDVIPSCPLGLVGITGFLGPWGGQQNDGARCFIEFYGGRMRDKRHKRRQDRLEVMRNFLTVKQGNSYPGRMCLHPWELSKQDWIKLCTNWPALLWSWGRTRDFTRSLLTWIILQAYILDAQLYSTGHSSHYSPPNNPNSAFLKSEFTWSWMTKLISENQKTSPSVLAELPRCNWEERLALSVFLKSN